ncbi:MAG: M48 family metallopeptidase, partial [Rhodovibrionaceae bacterium]|nr:M48 family metallopeptidase [Rhodovibrionaceae bacterium]
MRTLPIGCALLALGLTLGCSTLRIGDEEAGTLRPILRQIAFANAQGCADPAAAICQFDVRLVNKREPNAFLDRHARRIRITTGMLARTQSQDELAFVIAHELAHAELGHRRKFFGGQRAQEAEADWRAAELLHAAGFDPAAGIRLLARLGHSFGE